MLLEHSFFPPKHKWSEVVFNHSVCWADNGWPPVSPLAYNFFLLFLFFFLISSVWCTLDGKTSEVYPSAVSGLCWKTKLVLPSFNFWPLVQAVTPGRQACSTGSRRMSRLRVFFKKLHKMLTESVSIKSCSCDPWQRLSLFSLAWSVMKWSFTFLTWGVKVQVRKWLRVIKPCLAALFLQLCSASPGVIATIVPSIWIKSPSEYKQTSANSSAKSQASVFWHGYDECPHSSVLVYN